MKQFQAIAATMAGCLALLLITNPGLAQEPVVVRVTPANLALTVGGTSDVAVEVVDVDGLYGFDIRLSFDPAVVEVVDADPNKPGDQVSLGRMLDPGMSVRDSADNATGTIHYAMTQLNPSAAKSGTGNLIVIKLRGKTAGSSDLNITAVDLARRDASAIAASPEGGVVVVSAGVATQPTNTPIPTQAPPTSAPTAFPAASATPIAEPPTATQVVETATAAPEAAPATVPPDATATPRPPDPTATSQTDSAAPSPTAAATNTQEAAGSGTTPQPPATEEATPEPTATPQIVSAASSNMGGAAAASSPGETDRPQAGNPEGTLLTVGLVAFLAAALVAVVLVIVLARRRAAG